MATIIYDVNDLQDMDLDLTADYELANDIEAGGFGFTYLGTFTGSLDGKGFDIHDLAVTVIGGATRYGCFIRINQGTIKNLGLVDCVISVTSTDLNAIAASLVRTNDVTGVIENCHCSGTVTAIGDTAAYAFGLAVYNDGQIDESYSTVVTSATAPLAYAGGFTKENIGPINNSYARGGAIAIGATSYASGVVDQNFAGGVITKSYSTGLLAAASVGGFCRINDDTITACFWDTETSGTAVSDGGTGKTTAQMKLIATFAAWDIKQSASDLASGYPYLSWQLGSSHIWYIFGAIPDVPDSPRTTVDVADITPLEAIRNIEMAARGRFYTDEEGNAVYKSRYGRNP